MFDREKQTFLLRFECTRKYVQVDREYICQFWTRKYFILLHKQRVQWYKKGIRKCIALKKRIQKTKITKKNFTFTTFVTVFTYFDCILHFFTFWRRKIILKVIIIRNKILRKIWQKLFFAYNLKHSFFFFSFWWRIANKNKIEDLLFVLDVCWWLGCLESQISHLSAWSCY